MSGSGGGGGYQYQAQATAFIATHILAKQPLHWIEHSVADVPTVVAEETNGPGDDIRITLQDGSVVEVQAKHGLKKNEKFWEAIIKLIRGLVEDSSLYGVLLTDSTASDTIQDKLREDIIRLGQGREDNLKEITQEVIGRLREEGVSHSSDIFRRFRIVIADLDNSQRDAKTALVSRVSASQTLLTEGLCVLRALWQSSGKKFKHVGIIHRGSPRLLLDAALKGGFLIEGIKGKAPH